MNHNQRLCKNTLLTNELSCNKMEYLYEKKRHETHLLEILVSSATPTVKCVDMLCVFSRKNFRLVERAATAAANRRMFKSKSEERF